MKKSTLMERITDLFSSFGRSKRNSLSDDISTDSRSPAPREKLKRSASMRQPTTIDFDPVVSELTRTLSTRCPKSSYPNVRNNIPERSSVKEKNCNEIKQSIEEKPSIKTSASVTVTNTIDLSTANYTVSVKNDIKVDGEGETGYSMNENEYQIRIHQNVEKEDIKLSSNASNPMTIIDIRQKVIVAQSPPVSPTEDRSFNCKYVIKELLEGERRYMQFIKSIIENVIKPIRRESFRNVETIFGNIDVIYEQGKKFLEDLEKCEYDSDMVGRIFLEHKDLFQLYPDYSKVVGIPKELLSSDLVELVENRKPLLNTHLSFEECRLRPVQRIRAYVLLLEQLKKVKNVGLESVDKALLQMKELMKNLNDTLHLHSIIGNEYSLEQTGNYLCSGLCRQVADRSDITVLVFNKMVIFAAESKIYNGMYEYRDKIPMTFLRIENVGNESKFRLVNFDLQKKGHSACTYVLEAKDEDTKIVLLRTLHELLWQQLTKMRERSYVKTESVKEE